MLDEDKQCLLFLNYVVKINVKLLIKSFFKHEIVMTVLLLWFKRNF